MSKQVNIHEAKTHFSRIVQSVRDGSAQEVVIAIAGKPAARLVAYEPPTTRPLGIDEGLVRISDDFDAENERIAAHFLGQAD